MKYTCQNDIFYPRKGPQTNHAKVPEPGRNVPNTVTVHAILQVCFLVVCYAIILSLF